MSEAGGDKAREGGAEKAGRPAVKYVYRGEGTSWYQPWMWGTGRVISRVLSMLMFRLRVAGLENIPASGPALLATNHQSFLDPWLIGIPLRRQVHYMARDSLFKGGFLHWLGESLNAFPVKRGSADLGAVRMAIERLEKGYLVNIFPEGTRSLDGTIGPVAPGVALIVARSKIPVPIIPVVIDGAYGAWPRSAKLPRPHAIRILFGRPIPAEEAKGLKGAALAGRIREEMVRLQEQMRSPHAEASRRRLEEAAEGDEGRPGRGAAGGRERGGRGAEG